VRVFDHHEYRHGDMTQLVEHGLEQLRPRRLQLRGEARVGIACDVEQRRQRVRRLQGIARAPPDRLAARREVAQHAGLADAGFARDEHHLAGLANPRQAILQRAQGRIALDEIHRSFRREGSRHGRARAVY